MCDSNKTLLSFERNIYGDIFEKQLIDNSEKHVPGCQNFDESVLVKYYNDSMTHFKYGIKITAGNKSKYCLLYKEAYELDNFINDSAEFLVELNNFTDKGNGTYAASFGHDDMVMAEVQLAFVKDTLQYKLLKDDFDDNGGFVDDNIYNPFESSFSFNPQELNYYGDQFNNQLDAYKRLGMM